MLPAQRNKVDLNAMTEEERKLFRLYGKLPSKKDILKNKLKERKYFDSGDYALSKAGKASDVGVTNIGSQHPLPENIPHVSSTSIPGSSSVGSSESPIVGSPHIHSKSPIASGKSILADELAAEDVPDEAESAEKEAQKEQEEKPSETSTVDAVPIPGH